jgi:hypothetical protein
MVRGSPVHVSPRISNCGSIGNVQNYILLKVSCHLLGMMMIDDHTLWKVDWSVTKHSSEPEIN